MKNSTWNLVIGILIGAIITAAGFLMFDTNSTTANLEGNPSRLSAEVANGMQNEENKEMNNMTDKIENRFGNTVNKATNDATDIMNETSNMIENAPQKVENGIDSATNAVRNMINEMPR